MSDVVGLTGAMSSGKTVTSISLLKYYHDQGKRIISNHKLRGIPHKYLNSEDFVKFIIENYNNQAKIEDNFFNSVVFIDEARGLYSARRSMTNLAEITTSFIFMLSKLSCDFLYTTQLLQSQIDLQLRSITTHLLECERVNSKGFPYHGDRIGDEPVFIRIRLWRPSLINKGWTTSNKFYYFDPSPYYKYYNTREILIVNRSKIEKEQTKKGKKGQ